MPLSFKGVAHNIPGEKRKNRHDLSNAEISTASLGASGTPILVEHAGEPVGSVTSDWVSPNGALRVSGVINDPKAEALVRSGKMRELSLGQSLHTDGAGHPLWRSTDELSICSKAARPGCGINEIDGKQVRSVAVFSGKKGVCTRARNNPLTKIPVFFHSPAAPPAGQGHGGG